MNPDFNIRPVQKLIQPAGMVQMQMSNDDLLNVLNLVPRCFDGRPQLMLRFIANSGKDIGQSRAPNLGIILAAASLPEDQAFDGVFNENAVDGQLSAFVDKGLALGALGAGISSSDDESFITFQPSYLQNVKLGAFGADIRDVAWDGSPVQLSLDSCHCTCVSVEIARFWYVVGRQRRKQQQMLEVHGTQLRGRVDVVPVNSLSPHSKHYPGAGTGYLEANSMTIIVPKKSNLQ
jgi:hypothetical protein